MTKIRILKLLENSMIEKLLPWWVLFLLLFIPNILFSETLVYTGDEKQGKSGNISWFLDKNNILSNSEIIELYKSGKFVKGNKDIPNLGYKKHCVWFHISITNQTSEDKLLLELDFANYNEIDLYIYDSAFNIYKIQKQGVSNFSYNPDFSHRCPLFEIKTLTGKTYHLLFRIKNEAPLIFPLYIHTNHSFLKKENTRRQFSFVFFGLMLATVLFNLIFFFITKNKSYIFLALHLLCSLGNFVFYLGYGYEYFHYLNPKLLLLLKFDFYALASIFHILFIIYYLALNKKGFSRNIAIISALFYSIFFIITISGMLSVFLISQIAIYTYVFSVIINLTISIISIVRRNKNAIYYFFAFSIHLIASVVFMLTTEGLLAYNVFNTNIQIFASVIFGILLSAGLTEQFAINNALSASNLQLEKDKETLTKEVEERKRIEKQLIESENKFRMLIELLPHPLILTDIETGLIIEVNKSLIDVAGFSKNELIGKPTTKIGFWDYEDRVAYMSELVLQGKISGKQLKMKVSHDKILQVLMYSEIITINSEKRILTLVVDISEIKMKEEELELSEKKLIISNNTKDKFFSIIAHDLQNPLNVLLAYNKQLQSYIAQKDYEKAERYCKTMEVIAENTGSLIQNLLSWARVQTGLMNYNPDLIHALSLIENEVLTTKAGFDKKQITLSYKCPEELILRGDVNMLGTVIRNLLSNAYKYTHRGGIVNLEAGIKNNSYFITVSDNGTGINKKIKNNLFKIDELTHTAGTEEETGTGLGLILCNEFIKLHDGYVHVESELGKGSIFTVQWPEKL
jgi:PAS domain S-box-containing protein